MYYGNGKWTSFKAGHKQTLPVVRYLSKVATSYVNIDWFEECLDWGALFVATHEERTLTYCIDFQVPKALWIHLQTRPRELSALWGDDRASQDKIVSSDISFQGQQSIVSFLIVDALYCNIVHYKGHWMYSASIKRTRPYNVTTLVFKLPLITFKYSSKMTNLTCKSMFQVPKSGQALS